MQGRYGGGMSFSGNRAIPSFSTPPYCSLFHPCQEKKKSIYMNNSSQIKWRLWLSTSLIFTRSEVFVYLWQGK